MPEAVFLADYITPAQAFYKKLIAEPDFRGFIHGLAVEPNLTEVHAYQHWPMAIRLGIMLFEQVLGVELDPLVPEASLAENDSVFTPTFTNHITEPIAAEILALLAENDIKIKTIKKTDEMGRVVSVEIIRPVEVFLAALTQIVRASEKAVA